MLLFLFSFSSSTSVRICCYLLLNPVHPVSVRRVHHKRVGGGEAGVGRALSILNNKYNLLYDGCTVLHAHGVTHRPFHRIQRHKGFALRRFLSRTWKEAKEALLRGHLIDFSEFGSCLLNLQDEYGRITKQAEVVKRPQRYHVVARYEHA